MVKNKNKKKRKTKLNITFENLKVRKTILQEKRKEESDLDPKNQNN